MYQTSQAATNRNITRKAGNSHRHRRLTGASAGGGASDRGAAASVTRLLQVEIRGLANEGGESSRGVGDRAGAASRVPVVRSSDGRGPCGAPESSKLFLQAFPKFRLFSPSFSKESFSRFVGFQGVAIDANRKNLFPNFLSSPRTRRARRAPPNPSGSLKGHEDTAPHI